MWFWFWLLNIYLRSYFTFWGSLVIWYKYEASWDGFFGFGLGIRKLRFAATERWCTSYRISQVYFHELFEVTSDSCDFWVK